jgi:hypothetical protein
MLLFVSIVCADDSSSSSTTSSTDTSTSTSTSTTSIDDSALVTVTNVTMNPGVFFPYEEGTITVTLTNAGTSAIGLSNPDLMSNYVHIKEKMDWGTMTYIGAGQTMTYSFVVTADPPQGESHGAVYALFTVATQEGYPVHYPIQVLVSSDPLKAAITDSPTFSLSTPGNVTLTLMNCRDGALHNIEVTSEGTGVDVSPQQVFIGSLDADNSTDVDFEITPHQDTNVMFYVTYQNGDNEHSVNVTLPINLGVDKTAAVPILNDVALTTSGSGYDITGDVTNAGISDAEGVIVTVGSPANGTGTYPEYAIGSIASDDSGSFEVTFSCSDLTSVPVVISWKDSGGNDYSVTKTLDLTSISGTGISTASSSSKTSSSSASSMSGPGGMGGGPGGMSGGPGGESSSTSLFTSGKGGGISSFYPVIAAGIILIVGIVLWKKRKWISLKLKKQQ